MHLMPPYITNQDELTMQALFIIVVVYITALARGQMSQHLSRETRAPGSLDKYATIQVLNNAGTRLTWGGRKGREESKELQLLTAPRLYFIDVLRITRACR